MARYNRLDYKTAIPQIEKDVDNIQSVVNKLLGRTEDNLVHKDGNETITGEKVFTSSCSFNDLQTDNITSNNFVSNTVSADDVSAESVSLTGTLGLELKTKSPLWTNPQPTQNFGAQTISLTLNDYDMIEVWFWNNTDNDRMFNPTKALKGIEVSAQYGVSDIDATSNNKGHRNFTMTNSGVTFTLNRYNGGNHNEHNIPMYIYGIKIV